MKQNHPSPLARGIAAASVGAVLLTGCGGVREAAYQWGNVAIGGGGYVTGIVYSKGEAGLCYARTDIGGAYRWSSRDTQWVPITDHFGGVNGDDWNNIGIESIAADPVEPNRVYLACGTYMNENGVILCSADYGETWEQVEMPFPMGGNTSGRGVGERLAVHPRDNARLYYGSRTDGLYTSADYGKTWAKVESFPVKGNFYQEKNQIGVMWETFDPTTNDLYVAVAMKDGACLYRSKDDGGTWETLPKQTAGFYPLHGVCSENGNLYVTYADSCGPNADSKNGMVLRYSMTDDTVTNITPVCDDGRYGGFSGISVDGSAPNTIVCGTLGFWSKKGENLYRSVDGGDSWTPLFDNTADRYVMDVKDAAWLNWGKEQAQTGWWMADVEIDPFDSDVVRWGTGATIFATKNMTDIGSATPVTVAFDAYGLEETAVFQVVSTPVHDGTPALYSIMGDLTGFSHLDVTVRPDDNHFMKIGVPSDLAVAWNNGNIAVYASDHAKTPLRYTEDGGNSWQAFSSLPTSGKSGKVAVSADGKTVFWIPGALQAGVYFTHDFGGTWYISQGLGMGATVYADLCDASVFYGESGGKIMLSRDGGVTFTETGLTVAENSELVPSAEQSGLLWIRSGTSLGLSTDFGATVTYCKGVSANAIGVGAPKTAGDAMPLYFMGTVGEAGNGIFCTEDHGKTFEKLTTDADCFGNLTPSITGDATTYGRVYFATNGRGIVMGDRIS